MSIEVAIKQVTAAVEDLADACIRTAERDYSSPAYEERQGQLVKARAELIAALEHLVTTYLTAKP